LIIEFQKMEKTYKY